MTAPFKKKEVKVKTSDPVLYRARSIEVPDWYVAERMSSWGRLDVKEKALQQTKEWWLANLSPDWETHFTLDKVED